MVSYTTHKKIKDIFKGMTPSEIINYEDWDVLSFGIKRDEEMELPIDKLNVKYHADMENTRSDMEKYFKGETLDNLPPN